MKLGLLALEWNGVFLPAGTPAAIVERLNRAVNEAVRDPGVTRKLAGLTVRTRANAPADFAEFVGAEIDRWADVVKPGNVKPE